MKQFTNLAHYLRPLITYFGFLILLNVNFALAKSDGVIAHYFADPVSRIFDPLASEVNLDFPIPENTSSTFTLQFTETTPTCNGAFDGSLSVTPVGGIPPFTYQWNTGDTVASLSGITGNTYIVTVTDSVGNAVTDTMMLSQPDALSIGIGETLVYEEAFDQDSVYCPGSSNYDNWVNLRAAIDTNIIYTKVTFSGSETNTVYEMTDENAVKELIIAFKFGNEMNISSDGLTWRVGASCITGCSSSGDDIEINVTGTGSDCSCSAGPILRPCIGNSNWGGMGSTSCNAPTQTFRLEISGPTGINVQNISCKGLTDGSIDPVVTGGTAPYTYNWSTGSTDTAITNLSAGLYSLTLTDANGCSRTDTIEIAEPDSLLATVNTDASISCNGLAEGALSALPTGGTEPYIYQWSTGDSVAALSALVAGSYTVTVTDANGCSDVQAVQLTEPDVLETGLEASTPITCSGDTNAMLATIPIGGTAPFTYLWDNGDTATTRGPLGPGSYSITVTDANGCVDIDTLTLVNPSVLSSTASVDANVACNGDASGVMTALPQGGNSPYTFVWSNGDTAASATGLTAGVYTVNITDASGCTTFAIDTISEPTLLSSTAVVDANPSCFGDPTGGATASAQGGIAPYTFEWDFGALTASVTGVTAGTYQVAITDANGCIDTANVTITEPDLISTPLEIVSCESYELPSGAATITESGVYNDTLLSKTGCDSVLIITADITQIDASLTIADTEISSNETDVEATFQWIDCGNNNAEITGATSASYSPTASGNYAVVVNKNGCSQVSECATFVPVSTDRKLEETLISLYPNPTEGQFTINLNRTYENIQVKVYTPEGKMVYQKKALATDVIDMQLDTAAGVYYLEVLTGNGGRATMKLLKE